MSYHVAAVDRALALLEVMAQYPNLGVTELAERTGNTKSLVFRLLYTLEQRGYVHKNPDGRGYRLGYRTLFLAEHTRQQSALIAAAAPILDELAEATRENALLVVREDLHGVCIAMRESPQPLRLFAQVGRHVPLHAGGGPKVLLAFAPEEVRRAILERPLEGFTSTSITESNKLKRALAEIRQAGFTLSIGELDPDVFSMAAPVRDFTGDVVASLSITGPLSRLNAGERRRFRKLILDAADRLSAELGLVRTTAATA